MAGRASRKYMQNMQRYGDREFGRGHVVPRGNHTVHERTNDHYYAIANDTGMDQRKAGHFTPRPQSKGFYTAPAKVASGGHDDRFHMPMAICCHKVCNYS